MITLHVRRDRHLPLVKVSQDFPSYHVAIHEGQRRATFGNFTIDTGDRIPRRSEQLLFDPLLPVQAEAQPKRERKTKLNLILDGLDD